MWRPHSPIVIFYCNSEAKKAKLLLNSIFTGTAYVQGNILCVKLNFIIVCNKSIIIFLAI